METPELIHKVHEDIEGRYDLTAEDLYYIHAALCEMASLKKELEELKKDVKAIAERAWSDGFDRGASVWGAPDEVFDKAPTDKDQWLKDNGFEKVGEK